MRLTVPGIKEAESGFKPKPPGDYQVEPQKYEVRNTKDGQSQFIHWELNIVDGDFMGGKLFYNTPLRAEGLGITKAFYEACGITIESDDIDPDECLSIRIVAIVENDEYPVGSGQLRDKVVGVKPV